MGRTQSDAETNRIVAWHKLLGRAVDYAKWREKFLDDGDELNLALADKELMIAVEAYMGAVKKTKRYARRTLYARTWCKTCGAYGDGACQKHPGASVTVRR